MFDGTIFRHNTVNTPKKIVIMITKMGIFVTTEKNND